MLLWKAPGKRPFVRFGVHRWQYASLNARERFLRYLSPPETKFLGKTIQPPGKGLRSLYWKL